MTMLLQTVSLSRWRWIVMCGTIVFNLTSVGLWRTTKSATTTVTTTTITKKTMLTTIKTTLVTTIRKKYITLMMNPRTEPIQTPIATNLKQKSSGANVYPRNPDSAWYPPCAHSAEQIGWSKQSLCWEDEAKSVPRRTQAAQRSINRQCGFLSRQP